MNEIYILDISNLVNDQKLFNYHFNNVPKFRQERILKYVHLKDRALSLSAFIVLMRLLKKHKIKYKDSDFKIDQYGKPYLKNNPINFNLSHSGHYVIVGISNSLIGVDVESFNPKLNTNSLIRNVLNEEEKIKYQNQKNQARYFYKIWCQKESYLKCIGLGLNLAMPKVNFNDPSIKNYRFVNFFKDNHQFSICLKAKEKINYQIIKLAK